MMYNNGGRPLSRKKKVQILVALTLLAWATQTLLAQFARGAEAAPPPVDPGPAVSRERVSTAFVPRDGADASIASGTIELRAEARIYGGEVKLRQICRWSDADAAMFAPVKDLVLAKLDPRRPYKVLQVRDVKQLLEDAGVNVGLVRFSGPIECTVSRGDVNLSEGEALDQWVKAHEVAKPAEKQSKIAKTQAAAVAPVPTAAPVVADEAAPHSLRDLLVADLSSRLSIPADRLVLSFDAKDEGAVALTETQFKFNIQPRRVRDLGQVSWDVTVVSPAGTHKEQINGVARAWQDQVVVSKSMARNQLIQESDVTHKRAIIDRLPDATPLRSEQIVGQMAGRDLKPGTVVTAPLVEAVPLAKVNQLITVTVQRGGIRIKSVAKAMDGGSYGQTIRVKNEATKNFYDVVLTGPAEATLVADNATVEKTVASAAKK